MNKRAMAVLILLFLFAFCQPATAYNPYDLFGKGNCAYFCYDMMDTFWPETFEVRRWWDAREWVELDGLKQGEYQAELVSLSSVRSRDFIITPGSKRGIHGHVCFVLAIIPNSKTVAVLESANFASAKDYPYIYNNCRFRIHSYSINSLKDKGARVLTYSRIEVVE